MIEPMSAPVLQDSFRGAVRKLDLQRTHCFLARGLVREASCFLGVSVIEYLFNTVIYQGKHGKCKSASSKG